MSLATTDLMNASSEKTGAGQTSGFAVKRSKRVAVKVDITANAGTLTFFLETSDDNSTWYEAYEVAASTDPSGRFIQEFPVHEGYVRLRWTLSGGNATFSVRLVRIED